MAEGVTVLQRKLKQLITASESKLFPNVCAVGLNRSRADAAFHRDFP
jgi:hypothetical protein